MTDQLADRILSRYGISVLAYEEGGERVVVEHADGIGHPVTIKITQAEEWAYGIDLQ